MKSRLRSRFAWDSRYFFHDLCERPCKNVEQTPCYEVRALGTAIKVLGPPSDWDGKAQEKSDSA